MFPKCPPRLKMVLLLHCGIRNTRLHACFALLCDTAALTTVQGGPKNQTVFESR